MVVRRVDRASPYPDKITRAEELRLQLADDIVRGALPPYSGHFEAKGLKAPVEIVRDRNSVPHIIAGSIEDAAFGLGFVHAQDKVFSRAEMPHVENRLVTGPFDHPCDPLGPIAVGLVVANKDFRGLRRHLTL